MYNEMGKSYITADFHYINFKLKYITSHYFSSIRT